MTLEILDSRNQLVRRYSSDDKPQAVDPKSVDIPMYWFPPPPTLSAVAGHSRWLWDMHYAAPEGVTGRRRRGGNAGPWAPPGTYTVRLSYGGKAYDQKLTLEPDPRIKAPQAMYDEQFATATRAMDDAAKLAPALQQVASLRKKLAATETKSAAASAFTARLDDVAGAAPTGLGAAGSSHPTLNSLSGDFTAIAAAADSADAPVTAHAKQALRNAESALPALLNQWQALQAQVPAELK